MSRIRFAKFSRYTEVAARNPFYSGTIKNKGAISMNSSPDSPTENEKIWKTPTFRVIPISFEASAYALAEGDHDPLIG
jgi:hypothetical protein